MRNNIRRMVPFVIFLCMQGAADAQPDLIRNTITDESNKKFLQVIEKQVGVIRSRMVTLDSLALKNESFLFRPFDDKILKIILEQPALTKDKAASDSRARYGHVVGSQNSDVRLFYIKERPAWITIDAGESLMYSIMFVPGKGAYMVTEIDKSKLKLCNHVRVEVGENSSGDTQ